MPFDIQEVAEALLVICQSLKDDVLAVKAELESLQALLSGDVLRMLSDLHFCEDDQSSDSGAEWLPDEEPEEDSDEDMDEKCQE